MYELLGVRCNWCLMMCFQVIISPHDEINAKAWLTEILVNDLIGRQKISMTTSTYFH